MLWLAIAILVLFLVVLLRSHKNPESNADAPALSQHFEIPITCKVTFKEGPGPILNPEREGNREVGQRESQIRQSGSICKVAGVSFTNPDGTERHEVVDHCHPWDMLKLVPEPKNRFDHNAIAVKRLDDSQLGYLGRRLARRCSRMGKRRRAVGSDGHGCYGHFPPIRIRRMASISFFYD